MLDCFEKKNDYCRRLTTNRSTIMLYEKKQAFYFRIESIRLIGPTFHANCPQRNYLILLPLGVVLSLLAFWLYNDENGREIESLHNVR